MITCRQLIDFIGSYVEGELDERSRNAFERHLLLCASCRVYLASYRETIALVKILATDDPLDDVPEELVRVILQLPR
jgi:anti-sigma factor RsiW